MSWFFCLYFFCIKGGFCLQNVCIDIKIGKLQLDTVMALFL